MISSTVGPVGATDDDTTADPFGSPPASLAPSESVPPSSLLLGIPTTNATAAGGSLAFPFPLTSTRRGGNSPASPAAFLARARSVCSFPLRLQAP